MVIEQVFAEPFHAHQQFSFAVQRLAVHAAQRIVHNTTDAAARKLDLAPIGQLQRYRQRILARKVFRTHGLCQEAERYAQVIAAYDLSAVQAVVLQLLPLYGCGGKRPQTVFKPAGAVPCGKCHGKRIPHSGADGFAPHHSAVRLPVDTGE